MFVIGAAAVFNARKILHPHEEYKENIKPWLNPTFDSKAQGKLGNIVAETFVTRDVSPKFPCLPTRGNIVAEMKFASREARMFPIKFRNISCFPSVIFVAETLFPSVCPPWKTLAGNNVSATMFPSLPKA